MNDYNQFIEIGLIMKTIKKTQRFYFDFDGFGWRKKLKKLFETNDHQVREHDHGGGETFFCPK